MEIKITCEGATTVDIDELAELQGDLKDLSKENYEKLKASILQFGFTFPVFMWEEVVDLTTNHVEALAEDIAVKATMRTTKWVIDAHQRLRTLKTMRSEGYTIPKLPADRIFAMSKIEAKQKLLLANSQYGTMTNEGLYKYLNEPGAEIPLDTIEPLMVLPFGISFAYSDPNFQPTDPGDQPKLDEKKPVTCPECGHQFTLE